MLTVPPVLTIEPTSYAPGSSQQQPNLSLGTGTITAGPDRVWDLVRPVTLDGAQAYRDPSTGQIAVQTQIGTLLVQMAESTVPFGVPLSIRLTPGDPPLVTFMPSQGNAGQSGAARQGLIDVEETPAVLLSDVAATAETLTPGQIIVLAAVAGQVEQPLPATSQLPASQVPSAALPVPTAAPEAEPAPQVLLLNSAATATAVATPAASLPAVATSLGVATSASPAPTGGTAAAAATPMTIAVDSIPSKSLPAPGAPTTVQAKSTDVSVLLGSQTAPTSVAATSADATLGPRPATAFLPLTSNPAATQSQASISGSTAAKLAVSDDLAGLPSALAAQLPVEELAVAAQPAQAAGLAAAGEDEALLSMRIVVVAPAGTPLPPVPPGAVVATVEGSTLAGQPILRAGDHSLVVQTPATVQPGTRLILDPIAAAPARFALLPPPLDPIAGRSWPALMAAFPALADSHFALAEMVRLAIPQAGPLLGPVLLLFAAALRRGDVRGWLGDAPLNELQRAGHADLASALSSDFERASRQSAQALDDGWHTLPIPIFAEGGLSRVQFHLRRYKSSKGQEGDTGRDSDRDNVRFVVEAEPSATGPVQLDGLVRHPQDAPAALDLIVRSQMPLAPEMRGDIASLFTNSLAATGIKGAIVFQGGMNWVKVARDRASAASVMA